MSILGIGLDVVDLVRFRRTLDDLGIRFVQRTFTDREAEYAERSPRRRAERLGARFAAKEALGKATGLGMTGQTSWRQIEVVHDNRGRPTLELHGETEQTLRAMGVTHVHLSLSHDGDLAAAVVVLEGSEEGS
jgi:holo-[acyl-carrier protein] synthase